MIKLLVIADDFTGALDTGVQFKAKQTLIQIASEKCIESLKISDHNLQVLIVDAETRHMTAQDAYQTVYQIVQTAVEAGVPCIYKKTDSGLRGNIGSELTAALNASGNKQLHFIPAFPLINRITVNGIHYIDGKPVAQSVFGKDPFEPVQSSKVKEIIYSQSPVHTHLMGSTVPDVLPQGILVYDSAKDEDLQQIAQTLKLRGELNLLAGCAGFASVLPDLLDLDRIEPQFPPIPQKLLVICGSINPITLRQLDEAQRAGAPRIQLTPEQKLDDRWLTSPDGLQITAEWMAQLKDAPLANHFA